MRSSSTIRVLVALAVAAAVALAVPSPRPETVVLPPPGTLAGLVTDADRAVWVGHRRDDGSAVAGDTWVVEAAGDGLVPWVHTREGDELALVERLPRWPNLGLGAADTAGGAACTPDELLVHAAA